jgi:hypothetical protein
MKTLRPYFLVVDIGFLLYWFVTAFHLLPKEYLYSDYENPILVAWNWSFMPLDLLVSATGLSAIALWRKRDSRWETLALLSLAFTSASGLQAISYWVIRREFDLMWWTPNLFLLIYPWFFILPMLRKEGDEKRGK